MTLARGQALTAGATRGLAERLQVRQSDTTEATRWIKASLSSGTDSRQSAGLKAGATRGLTVRLQVRQNDTTEAMR